MATALRRLSLGNFSNVRGAGAGVFEYKIDFGPGYRIYFAKDGESLIILLAGGAKKRQRRDIQHAIGNWMWSTSEGNNRWRMPLTRDFKETIAARAERDPEFRYELLREGVECLIAGQVATGRAILRDYINATGGFADVSKATNISAKSLMRMLGPRGNPRARNLFDIVAYLQRREDLRFRLERQTTRRRAPRRRQVHA